MKKSECKIVVFPKVKNYHTVKLEDMLAECKIVGSGIITDSDLFKRKCRANFIGEFTESKNPIPLGFVSEERGVMILLPKAEVSISGSKMSVKWHEIKRRKNLAGYMIIPITPN